MAGLSVLLESQKKKTQVINKIAVISNPQQRPLSPFSPLPSPTTPFCSSLSSPMSGSSSSSSHYKPTSTFLDQCFLCGQKLLPAKDIYMYKGDRGFCSVECRYRQMFMDEQQETIRKDNCALAAIKRRSSPSSPSSSSSAVPPASAADASRRHRHPRKATGAGGAAAGGFAYIY